MGNEKDSFEELTERITEAARSVAGDLHFMINQKGIRRGMTLAASLCREKGFNEAADAIIEDRDMPF